MSVSEGDRIRGLATLKRKVHGESLEQATLFGFYKNIVFPAEAEFSFFSANFKPEILLRIFLNYRV